jgi:hypothetical protein
MGRRVWDQVVTLNVGFMERLRSNRPNLLSNCSLYPAKLNTNQESAEAKD